ncbi:hypothetical protein I548_2217 [Mycobacterium intracellulare]|nr:hypothetical protein I548_2217 [Mycobacterium intracellulare]
MDDQATPVDLDVHVPVDVNARELDTYDRVVTVLDDLGGGRQPLLSGLFQSAAAAGPKKSRSHRSVSQAGRDHSARLLMVLPLSIP